MAQAELPPDHISDYERAVCYYALPRVLNPVTFGLIIAYAICLLEAAVAIAVGIAWENDLVLKTGVYAFGGMIIFGLLVFFLRALQSDVRKRRLLREAQEVPEATRNAQLGPDPFEGHLLLRRPIHTTQALYACTENDATIQYFVEHEPSRGAWRIRTAQDYEVCRIKVRRGPGSFVFSLDLPRLISVCVNDEEIARIVRRFSFDSAVAQVKPKAGHVPELLIRSGGIFLGDRLVGRIYHLRGSYYLDIQKVVFNEAILAYFVTVT